MTNPSPNTFTDTYHLPAQRACAADLLASPPPAPHFPVSALIPQGITLLGAKSLAHLTTFSLSLALSIAQGQPALDLLPTSQGDVLYLTTNYASAQRQLHNLATTTPNSESPSSPPSSYPKNIILIDINDTDPTQLAATLQDHLNTYPQTHFIVIDTLLALCRNRRSLINHYTLLSQLRQICERHRASILLPYQLGRISRFADTPEEAFAALSTFAGDPETHFLLLTQYSDSYGIATFDLLISGYLTDTQNFPLVFAHDSYHWSITAHDAIDYPISEQRYHVLQVLHLANTPLSSHDIADRLNLPLNTVKRLIHAMQRSRQLFPTGDHCYWPTDSKFTPPADLPPLTFTNYSPIPHPNSTDPTPPDNSIPATNSTPPGNSQKPQNPPAASPTSEKPRADSNSTPPHNSTSINQVDEFVRRYTLSPDRKHYIVSLEPKTEPM